MRLFAAAPFTFTVFFLGVEGFAGLDFAEPRLPTVPDNLKVPEPFPPAMARILWRRSWIARGVGASSVAAGKVLVCYYLSALFQSLTPGFGNFGDVGADFGCLEDLEQELKGCIVSKSERRKEQVGQYTV